MREVITIDYDKRNARKNSSDVNIQHHLMYNMLGRDTYLLRNPGNSCSVCAASAVACVAIERGKINKISRVT